MLLQQECVYVVSLLNGASAGILCTVHETLYSSVAENAVQLNPTETVRFYEAVVTRHFLSLLLNFHLSRLSFLGPFSGCNHVQNYVSPEFYHVKYPTLTPALLLSIHC